MVIPLFPLIDAAVLAACVVVAVCCVRKIKAQKRIIRIFQRRVERLMADNNALKNKMEEISGSMRQDSMAADERKQMPSMILDKDAELQFREVFAQEYPGFVERLRRNFPSLTANNELLCMLIRLYKSNDEIAQALGISRESVVTARYRLRSRFRLPKDADLNEFIQSM